MLYPQQNRCRSVFDLSGFWEIKVDYDHAGEEKGWGAGFEADAYIGVPGSWNEQLTEMGLMNYIGPLWYQTQFHVPPFLSNQKVMLRFGSADSHAKVWVNGKLVGEHNCGFLPFEFDISSLVNTNERNVLVVRVCNELSYDTIPQGLSFEDYEASGKKREQTYPPTHFDFFHYGGLNRPVKIMLLNKLHLRTVEIETTVEGSHGIVKLKADYGDITDSTQVEVILADGKEQIWKPIEALASPILEDRFVIPKCRLWNPEEPYLYKLHFKLFKGDDLCDEYLMDIGVREFEVKDDTVLLNGKPIFLKGFGKHEDFPVLGKGLSYPLITKDFQLMRWIGANSFRTSHYPYSEEIMQMADRLGLLVIDEVPAVSLNFKYVTPKTLENHKRALTELIARDRNHPSVVCWSVANEPGIWGEDEALSEEAEKYWTEIFHLVRTLDPSRPVTLPACAKWGTEDLAYKFSDIISVNRYWGWYEIPGDIERAGERLKAELEELYTLYKKPILVSEFGADTIEGQHATYPQLFTEEYQTMLIERYFEVIESLSFTVGEHIWNFADFMTAQHHRRVVLNRKGVFNRQRQPKSVAFAIRDHWKTEK